MANTTRAPRENETREKTYRPTYQPSSSLPDPTPEPGYRYRWIATHIMGQSDPTRVSKMRRDGWEPVKAVDHPELMLEGNATTGNVEIGGLMLCKNTEENVKAYDEYYNGQAASQMDSVDNHFMKNNDPRMPLFAERNSTVTRGRGFGSGLK